MAKKPHELLQESVETFKQRAEVYGDNYKKFGVVMQSLFPAGLLVNSVEEWNRIGLFIQDIAKTTRYVENWHKGGHDDSLNDKSVYSAMLRSLDQEYADVNGDDIPKKWSNEKKDLLK